VRGRNTERSRFGWDPVESFPDKASSDHALTSELSALPSTRRWVVDQAMVKPPHENDIT